MQVKLTLTIYNSMKYYINVEVLDTFLDILDVLQRSFIKRWYFLTVDFKGHRITKQKNHEICQSLPLTYKDNVSIEIHTYAN